MLEHISKFIFRVKYQEQKLCEDIDNKEKNTERTIKKTTNDNWIFSFHVVWYIQIYKYHVLLQTGSPFDS